MLYFVIQVLVKLQVYILYINVCGDQECLIEVYIIGLDNVLDICDGLGLDCDWLLIELDVMRQRCNIVLYFFLFFFWVKIFFWRCY